VQFYLMPLLAHISLEMIMEGEQLWHQAAIPNWLLFIDKLATRFPQVNEASWFQQDGVACHTARVSVDAILLLLHNHIISRNSDSPWSPRSAVLSACDFFMGALKKRSVHSSPTQYWSAERKKLWKNCQNSFGDAMPCHGKHVED
jgi:hypothetical protein